MHAWVHGCVACEWVYECVACVNVRVYECVPYARVWMRGVCQGVGAWLAVMYEFMSAWWVSGCMSARHVSMCECMSACRVSACRVSECGCEACLHVWVYECVTCAVRSQGSGSSHTPWQNRSCQTTGESDTCLHSVCVNVCPYICVCMCLFILFVPDQCVFWVGNMFCVCTQCLPHTVH